MLPDYYLTREFHVKLHLKTEIALIASRFVRYRFSRGIPSSGNEFSYNIQNPQGKSIL